MLSPRVLLSLLVAGSVAGLSMLTGCATDTSDGADDEENVVPGDGSDEQAIVSEHQLNGSELPSKTVSLTFDDGPGERTIELADWLADQGIHATFFINGKNVPGRQNALAEIVAKGHIIGNHTQNHLALPSLSSAKVVEEIRETDAFIKTAQPNGPWLLRAPYGSWSQRLTNATNATEYKKYTGSIFWDAGGVLTSTAAADWDCWGKHVAVDRCGSLYLNEIRHRGHGIVLMHDIHSKTVDMVKTVIVPTLKAEGWKFAQTTEVPSIARSIANQGSSPPDANQCSSSTLGRSVGEGSCVQSRSTNAWNRCHDGEWIASTATDNACTSRYPL